MWNRDVFVPHRHLSSSFVIATVEYTGAPHHQSLCLSVKQHQSAFLTAVVVRVHVKVTVLLVEDEIWKSSLSLTVFKGFLLLPSPPCLMGAYVLFGDGTCLHSTGHSLSLIEVSTRFPSTVQRLVKALREVLSLCFEL